MSYQQNASLDCAPAEYAITARGWGRGSAGGTPAHSNFIWPYINIHTNTNTMTPIHITTTLIIIVIIINVQYEAMWRHFAPFGAKRRNICQHRCQAYSTYDAKHIKYICEISNLGLGQALTGVMRWGLFMNSESTGGPTRCLPSVNWYSSPVSDSGILG